jgi:hypothetical protein
MPKQTTNNSADISNTENNQQSYALSYVMDRQHTTNRKTEKYSTNHIPKHQRHWHKHTTQNMTTLLSEQIAIESDILCMTEHCINIRHQDIHHQIQSTIQCTIQEKVNIQITSSHTHTETPYLLGGTAIAIVGNAVGRIQPTSRGGDSMGRWTYFSFKRKHQHPITIISAYQVNIRPTNNIGLTAWHQQQIALNQIGKSHLHPRQAFIQISPTKSHTSSH